MHLLQSFKMNNFGLDSFLGIVVGFMILWQEVTAKRNLKGNYFTLFLYYNTIFIVVRRLNSFSKKWLF